MLGSRSSKLPAMGRLTLVYSSHNTEHSNVVTLQDFLQHHLGSPEGRIRQEKEFMVPEFNDAGIMTDVLARFDLMREIADAERQKPWQAGHSGKTLFKKNDFRVVLICMEASSNLKEHHADGTISVQVLRGAPSASPPKGGRTSCSRGTCSRWPPPSRTQSRR